MLEKILDRRNIEKALLAVECNKGAAGIDGMQSDELRPFINTEGRCFLSGILSGSYRPLAVRKVEIPKPNGGKRILGIPVVKDRLIQQAIYQWLSPQYDPDFSNSSYGFRRGKNAHQAVLQAQAYLNAGFTWIIELDLANFFDRVNHQRLLSLLSRRISDTRVLRLISFYLKSGLLEGGMVSQRTEGTPQGSPLSPLLSNIILDELDKELEVRGHRFVRYADDCSIYVRSRKSAERVMTNITKFIENSLRLEVNRDKSCISRPHQSNLLGFSFYKHRKVYEIRVSPKAVERVKSKCKTLTRSSDPSSEKTKLDKLNEVIVGWVNYFSIAKCKTRLDELDCFIRIRLRISVWRRWKRIRTRMKQLQLLGYTKRQAHYYANTSKGPCRIAHSPVLLTTLDKNYWRKLGYKGFYDYYYYRSTEYQPTIL